MSAPGLARRSLLALATGATAALVATACAVPDAGASGATGVSGASGAAPLTVPLTEGPSPFRLGARVEVGGAPLRVLVDTGSVGLRVRSDRVPAGATTPVGPAPAESYGSGITLTGTVARAPVRIGGRDAVTGVPVELVTDVGCVPQRPRCPTADGGVPDTFGGAFDGILGIGTNAVPRVPNPLWYLGPPGHAYTVRYRPGQTSDIVLGEPATGYVPEHLAPLPRPADPADGPPTWRPTVPVCVTAAPLPGGRACGPTLLDTGTAALATIDPAGGSDVGFAPSTAVTIGSGTGGGWSADYVVGPDGTAGLAPRSSGAGGSVVGLPAFGRLDVRFDLDAGTIGVRELTAGPMPASAAPSLTTVNGFVRSAPRGTVGG